MKNRHWKFRDSYGDIQVAMIPVGLTKREYKKLVAELARLLYYHYCQHRQNLVLKSSESAIPCLNKESA